MYDNNNHIYPVGDSKNHVFTKNCHCKPCLVIYEGENTVIHNPYDLRDFWEQDKQYINDLFIKLTSRLPAWGREGKC